MAIRGHDGKLDALLTLTLRDCERAQILFRSLTLVQPLGVCWVVVPDLQVDEIRRKIPAGNYRLVPESTLVPELAFYKRVLRFHPRRWRRRLPGSVIHQLIKIAIAPLVETPFYLSFDSDVFCLKRVQYEDLVRNGRAINKRNRENLHPDWYQGSERLLGLRRSGFEHGVTPNLYSRDGMIRLQEHLERRVHPLFRTLARALRAGSRRRNLLASWRSYLIRNSGWTENTLYTTFLEATNLYDTYHFDGGPDAVYTNCVWFADQFDSWDPARILAVPNSYFCLVQSTTGIEPRLVAEKIADFIG